MIPILAAILRLLIARPRKQHIDDDWFPRSYSPFTRDERNEIYAACVGFKMACMHRRGINFHPAGEDPLQLINACFQHARAIARKTREPAALIILAIKTAGEIVEETSEAKSDTWQREDAVLFNGLVRGLLKCSDRIAGHLPAKFSAAFFAH